MSKVNDRDIRTTFRLMNPSDVSFYSLSVKDLFNPSHLHNHFAWMMEHCGSPTKGHAASITAKRIGYLVAILIYLKHVDHREVCFKNATMHTITPHNSSSGWLPVYSYPSESIQSEKAMVDWISNDLYAKELVPLVSLLGKEKGISKITLFENIYTYIKWVLVDVLNEEDIFVQLVSHRLTDFGAVTRHPLAFYETETLLRKTCCLSNLTIGQSKKCTTCPLK